MTAKNVSRRNFSMLATAAFGGLLTGGSSAMAQADKPKIYVDPALLLTSEKNVCRGLNTCKGKGKGDHACAGQGACATAAAHTCAGQSSCKGQGGCGGYPGQNACKEHSQCAVPLSEKAWTLARKQFEQLAKGAGIKVGAAPKK